MADKKKHKGIKVLIIVGIILTLIIGGVIILARRVRDLAKQMTKPSQAVVTVGTISKKVDGAGNIAVADSVEIKIPSELTVSEKTVNDGDIVHRGDIVAKIDKDSVTSAIVKLQNELDQVKQSLKNKKKNKLTQYEIEELETRKSKLENRIDLMKVYYDNPVVAAPEDGIVCSPDSSSGGSIAGNYNISEYAKYLSSNDAPASKGTVTVKAEDGDEDEVITDYEALNIEVPVRGKIPQKTIDCDLYSGEIVWSAEGSEEPVTEFAPGTQYSALIILTPKQGYRFSPDHVPEISGIIGDAQIVLVDGSMVIRVVYPATEDDPGPSDPTAPADPTQPAGPTVPGNIPSDFDYEKYLEQINSLTNGRNGLDLSGQLPSGIDYGDIASAYGSSGSSSSFSDTVVMNIARTDNVKISIMVNELDVLSVKEGQKALITLDAVRDKTYEGTISKVALTAESTEGMANYRVDIIIPMDSQMRIGMSASASIEIRNAQDILLLPMKALQQRGDQLYVYRSCDENGVLKDEQIVTTGMSDATNVEITSGLNEGDVVYYIDQSSNPLAQYMTEAEEGS